MAIYDYEAKLLEDKEKQIFKKLEKSGLVTDSVIVLNQDYDFIKGGRSIRAEKGSIGIIKKVIIDGIDKNENAKCTLSMYFYASDYYLSLNFSTTENNDNKIAIEGNQIDIKDLLTVLDERNEITQAVKQYEELDNAFNEARSQFNNSINLWKVLRVLAWIVFIVAFAAVLIVAGKNITSTIYFIIAMMADFIVTAFILAWITLYTDIDYEETRIGKKKEKELEAALEVIEELDKKSCGERENQKYDNNN